MLRRLFTWRMNLYRLIVGAIVLAIVIPAWVFGVPAMWLPAPLCVLFVVGGVVVGARGWGVEGGMFTTRSRGPGSNRSSGVCQLGKKSIVSQTVCAFTTPVR